MKKFFGKLFIFVTSISLLLEVNQGKLLVSSNQNLKKNKKKERQLGIGDSLVNARAMLQQKQVDNPLSDLWDPDHLKVAKQTVDLNMNMPLNRLKLHLDDTYVVKVVAHNDHDYDELYKYFHPEEEEDDGI